MSQSQKKIEQLVSICIPIYNGEKTIERTLKSIISQSYQNIEIIVVDNKSDDSSLDIVKKFKDPRIKIIEHDNHLDSAEKNWNTCFRYANGKYMAIFHADDIYDSSIVEKEVFCFQKYPDIGAVFTSAIFIDENDRCFGQNKLPPQITHKETLTFKDLFPLVMENWNFFICPSAMVKVELYKELSPFRYEKFRSSSDLDMWFRILEKSPVLILKEKLMQYRITQASGSYSINYLRTEKADFFKVTEYYLAIYPNFHLSAQTRKRYRYFELLDNLLRAKNCILLNRRDESIHILHDFVIGLYVRPLFFPIGDFDYLKIWISGFMYLLMIKLFPLSLKKIIQKQNIGYKNAINDPVIRYIQEDHIL